MELVQDYTSDDDEKEDPTAVGQVEGFGEQSRGTNDHQGRLRSFPHQEGNYAAHVYVSVSIPSNMTATIHTILADLKRRESLLQPLEASAAPPRENSLVQPSYHVSLSRVVPIRYHEIEPLLLSLKEYLTPTKRTDLSFGDLEVFENDDHTRTFLALGIAKGRHEVCKVIRRVDKAFRDHGLRRFHSQPRPHASMLWMLGSTRESLEAMLHEEVSVSKQAWEELKMWTFPLETISCKIGQRVTTVWHNRLLEPRNHAQLS